MTSPLFEKAFETVLRHEGGYVNNPADPGGETKYGISRRSYPNEDIKHLTIDRAMDLYYMDFWLPLQPEDLPEPVAVLLFDMAVNMGRSRAVGCLQSAVGVEADGILGPATKQAIKANFGPKLLQEITVRRIMFYSSLETFKTFGLGWIRRSISTLVEV